MAKQIYVNLPVSDLVKATAFYEALGFVKSPIFSNENASGMSWSEDIVVMLLTHDFYKQFLQGKEIADTQATSSALLCLTMDSKEEVQKFADTAKENGGSYHQVDMGIPTDQMFGYEVQDLDGNTWEPMWMSTDFDPQATA